MFHNEYTEKGAVNKAIEISILSCNDDPIACLAGETLNAINMEEVKEVYFTLKEEKGICLF